MVHVAPSGEDEISLPYPTATNLFPPKATLLRSSVVPELLIVQVPLSDGSKDGASISNGYELTIGKDNAV